MKRKSNRDIFIKFFWEHVTFGWRFPDRLCNRGTFYRLYRIRVAGLVQQSISMMANPQERHLVQNLLEEKYGAELIMREEDLGYPDPAIDDLESWQPAFDRLRSLFGSDVATMVRLGKDLRRYAPYKGLLQDSLKFSRLDKYRFSCEGTSANRNLIVHIQEFPREHLYRVEANHDIILEFDDWPIVWARDW